MKSFETPAGKKIELITDLKTAHVRIQFVPGGQLPDELTGLYTSELEAEKDVLMYLDRIKDRKPKEK